MPYTKQSLQNLHALTIEEVDETLIACKLPTDRDDYTDEEIEFSFNVIRGYFISKQASNYTQAAELFEQSRGVPSLERVNQSAPEQISSNGLKQVFVMRFSEMRSWVSEALDTPISPIEAGKLLEASGLPDQEEYTESEVERFLSACDLMKKQGYTIAQIAAHFQSDQISSSGDNKLKPAAKRVAELIEESATTAKKGFAHLIDTVVALEVKGISAHVNQSYLQQASLELEAGRNDIEIFYAELEEWTKSQIEGKSQARSLEATWEWAADSLPPSSPKPPLLPKASDNGTTDE